MSATQKTALRSKNRTSRKAYTYALVKPAGPDCNLACRYCFYYRKSDYFGNGSHRMSHEILETLIRKCIIGYN